MEQWTKFPPVKWSMRHPRIAAWAVLAFGMVTFLVIEARDVGLQAGNWIALIVATILVAGACIWIVSWEDGDETEPDPNVKVKTGEIPQVILPTQTSTEEEHVHDSAIDAHDPNHTVDSDGSDASASD